MQLSVLRFANTREGAWTSFIRLLVRFICSPWIVSGVHVGELIHLWLSFHSHLFVFAPYSLQHWPVLVSCVWCRLAILCICSSVAGTWPQMWASILICSSWVQNKQQHAQQQEQREYYSSINNNCKCRRTKHFNCQRIYDPSGSIRFSWINSRCVYFYFYYVRIFYVVCCSREIFCAFLEILHSLNENVDQILAIKSFTSLYLALSCITRNCSYLPSSCYFI